MLEMIHPSGKYLRRRARRALGRQWKTMLALWLVTVLPLLAAEALMAFATPELSRLTAQYKLLNTVFGQRGPSLSQLPRVLRDARPIVYAFIIGMPVLLLIVQPYFMLGYRRCMLRLLGGETVRFCDAFAKDVSPWRAAGLELLLAARQLLWMVPWSVGSYHSAWLLLIMGALRMQTTMNTFFELMFTCMVVWLYFRYVAVALFQAQYPEKRVFACVREGVAFMRGYRNQLLKTMLPLYIMLALLLTAIIALYDVVIAPVWAIAIVAAAAGIPLLLYYTACLCAFYHEYDYRSKQKAVEEAAAQNEAPDAAADACAP